MHRLLATAVLFTCLRAATISAEPPTFQTHRVGTYRSEACGVGDFNNDGKLDIVAGPYLYLAPDWKAVEIRKLQGSVDEQGKQFRQVLSLQARCPIDGVFSYPRRKAE